MYVRADARKRQRSLKKPRMARNATRQNLKAATFHQGSPSQRNPDPARQEAVDELHDRRAEAPLAPVVFARHAAVVARTASMGSHVRLASYLQAIAAIATSARPASSAPMRRLCGL